MHVHQLVRDSCANSQESKQKVNSKLALEMAKQDKIPSTLQAAHRNTLIEKKFINRIKTTRERSKVNTKHQTLHSIAHSTQSAHSKRYSVN